MPYLYDEEENLDPDDINAYPKDEDDPELAEVTIDVDKSVGERNARLQDALNSAAKSSGPSMGNPFSMPGLKSNLVSSPSLPEPELDDRSKLVKNVQDSDSDILSNIFAGLAGFGAGVRGGSVAEGFKTAKENSMSKSNRALSEYDKAQQLGFQKEDRQLKRTADDRAADRSRREGQKWQQEQEQYRNDNDPNSPKSQAYRQFLVKALKINDPDVLQGMEGKSFADLEKSTGVLTKQFDQNWDETKHTADLAQREKESTTRIEEARAIRDLAQGNRTFERNQYSDSQQKELAERKISLKRVKDAVQPFLNHPEWIGNLSGNIDPSSQEERLARAKLLNAKADWKFAQYGSTTSPQNEKEANDIYPNQGAFNIWGSNAEEFNAKAQAAVERAQDSVNLFEQTIAETQNKNPSSAPNPGAPARGPARNNHPDTTKQQFLNAKPGSTIWKGNKPYKKISNDVPPEPIQ